MYIIYKIKLFKKIQIIIFFLFSTTLLSCAPQNNKLVIPEVPFPNFKLVEIGDMLCAPDIENKIKFDKWLADMDKYIAEMEELE